MRRPRFVIVVLGWLVLLGAPLQALAASCCQSRAATTCCCRRAGPAGPNDSAPSRLRRSCCRLAGAADESAPRVAPLSPAPTLILDAAPPAAIVLGRPSSVVAAPKTAPRARGPTVPLWLSLHALRC